jgi:hypothetical protein
VVAVWEDILEIFAKEAARAIAAPIILGTLLLVATAIIKATERVFGFQPTRENVTTLAISIPTFSFALLAILASGILRFVAMADFSICAFFLVKFVLYRRRAGR